MIKQDIFKQFFQDTKGMYLSKPILIGKNWVKKVFHPTYGLVGYIFWV